MPTFFATGGLAGPLDQIARMLTPNKVGPADTAFSSSFMDASGPSKQIIMGQSPDTAFLSGPPKLGPAELSSPFIQDVTAQALPGQHQASGNVGSFSAADTSVLNQYNGAFAQAGAKYGIDPNWLKSIAATERGWEGTSVAGAQGLMQVMPGGYPGLEAMYPNWKTDPVQNIMLGAAILASKRSEVGGDLNRATMNYLGSGTDAYGTTPDMYLSKVQSYNSQLGSSGGTFNTGNPVGNSIVATAEQYLGTPYVWGGIPGKGQSPTSAGGGWDCSGFTYWLDQNYGGGTLPMGAHYQYQQAVDQGKLFHDTSQLQPGDLIFFDTGWQGGAGAEMNRAGHVAMYIGNGQIIHAANPEAGTIISPLSDYYTSIMLGAEHMQWSGGGSTTSGGSVFSPTGRPGGSLASSIQNFLAGMR